MLACALLAVSACHVEAPPRAAVDPVLAVDHLPVAVVPLAPKAPVEALGAALVDVQAEGRCTSVKACAAVAIAALKRHDTATLAALAHPTKGVRFTPYAYVDTIDDVVLRAAELRGAELRATRRSWGEFDGSGEPIELSFSGYLQRFVYSGNFASVSPSYDAPIRSSNTDDNSREAYPAATIVEYYLPGTAPTEGMDWMSLKLIFETEEGVPYVVGVIHSEWTI